jgi:aminoglycoside phosphotransferase family enzyme/predicted kinase
MSQGKLIQALQRPEIFPHPVERFEVRETHISWVLLTGPFAYKIKKPVDLGFLDFSTLEKRGHYCKEELRLNRRLAPQLYLEVVPICGSHEAPRFYGPDPPIEYAVKMLEFPQRSQLDRVLARGDLKPGHIDTLAEMVADFHGRAAVAPQATPFGSPEGVYVPVAENFSQIRLPPEDLQTARRLEALAAWSAQCHAELRDSFAARKQAGFVRECHGDMHLGNMALLGNELVIFDCIEFSESLRWIDVMSEVAFLVMDLDDRSEAAFAWRFLNRYLEHTGDYGGLGLLRFYQTYRAMVRAKVTYIRLQQEPSQSPGRSALERDFRGYLALAERYPAPLRPFLAIAHGLSGSGKTTLTQSMVEALGVIRARSDVERKRLFGLAPLEPSRSELGGGLYTEDASQRTYARLLEVARSVLHAGFPVVIDATFLKARQRGMFRELAASMNVPFAILAFEAPDALLRARLERRAERKSDASEAGPGVLELQMRALEPLTEADRAQLVSVAADGPLDIAALRSRLEA